jgi:hypothetical protein
MYFLFTQKLSFPKSGCTKYIYNEVNGCTLASISTSEIVVETEPDETKETE